MAGSAQPIGQAMVNTGASLGGSMPMTPFLTQSFSGIPQADTKTAPYDPNRVLPPNYQEARDAFQRQLDAQNANNPLGRIGLPVTGNDQFGQQFGMASDAEAFNQFYNQNYGTPAAGYTTTAPRFLPSEPITPGAPDPRASSIDATIRPFLTEGLRQAQELFLRQQPSMYPGQTYVSPSEQTLTALQQQENIARQASPFLGAAQGAYLQSLGGLSNTAAGQFLNANPYQQQMMQAATRPLQQAFSEQVLPGISSLYSKSGRLGSGSMERALGTVSEQFGRSLGDITSNIAGQQYQQERGLQQQAALQLANLAQAAPQIYGQQFLPSQTLGQIGAQREAIAAQPLQEQMSRYAFQQQLPYQQLSGYLSSVYGSPLGSFGTPAAQPQFSGNRTVGALGGALAGGLGGYALGQAFPSVGGFLGGYGAPAIGAIGGGLLGGGYF
jgi:hypothetical protein